MFKKLSSAQLGDFGESFFATEALKRGFIVSKPFGSYQGYDFLLDTGSNVYKIQVKSINEYLKSQTQKSRARIHTKKPRNYDFLAAIDLVRNVLYIIPEDILKGGAYYVNNAVSVQYGNAWHLLK